MNKDGHGSARSFLGKIFAPDGHVVNILVGFSDLVILNVLCILSCLPIVTAGAGLSAAFLCSQRIVRDEGNITFSEFFSAWRKSFRRVTPVWLLMLGVLLLTIFELGITVSIGGTMRTVSRGILTILLIVWLALSVYLFPVLALEQGTRRDAVRLSALLAVANLPKTLLMMAITLLPLAVLFLLPGLFGALFLALLILGVEGIILANAAIFESIMKQL